MNGVPSAPVFDRFPFKLTFLKNSLGRGLRRSVKGGVDDKASKRGWENLDWSDGWKSRRKLIESKNGD